MKKYNNKYIVFSFITITLIFYLSSYFVFDPSSLGNKIDYINFMEPSIKIFVEYDLLYSLQHYKAAMNPLYFIILSFIVKIIGNDFFILRTLSIIVTFTTLMLFFIIYKDLYKDKMTSFLLLLPIALSYNLKGAAVWINTDNLPLFFLALSYLFYLNLIKEVVSARKQILTIFVVQLFAFLAFYVRQFYLWYAIYIIFLITINSKERKIIGLNVFFMFLFLIPQIFLFDIWGGLVNPSFKHHVVKNIDFTSISLSNSYFVYYFIPFFFLLDFSKLKLSLNYIDKKFLFVLICSFILSLFISFLFDVNRLSVEGGGILTRILFLINNKIIITLIIFVFNFMFFVILGNITCFGGKISEILPIILFVAVLYTSIFVTPKYFDPIIYILLFIVLKEKILSFSKGKSYIMYFTMFQAINYIGLVIWILVFK